MNESLVQALLAELINLNYHLKLVIDQQENSKEFQKEVLKRLKSFDMWGVGTRVE